MKRPWPKRLWFWGGALVFALMAYRGGTWSLTGLRGWRLRAFLADPDGHPHWIRPAHAQCPGAPFRWPSTGYPGFLRGDSWGLFHWHTGVDIFSGQAVGKTPVYAAYEGRLYRLAHWRATVAIRHRDPLHPTRFIWTYYTHMADPQGRSRIVEAFPPGTRGVYVAAGTLLGYQGNYSGRPGRPVGVHLHFSIVKDAGGLPANESFPWNTLDPSPYLGMPLTAWQVAPWRTPECWE